MADAYNLRTSSKQFPIDVAHEDGVLELDVRFVLVLQLLRIEGPHAGPKLEL